jgi:hypothetical protein
LAAPDPLAEGSPRCQRAVPRIRERSHVDVPGKNLDPLPCIYVASLPDTSAQESWFVAIVLF